VSPHTHTLTPKLINTFVCVSQLWGLNMEDSGGFLFRVYPFLCRAVRNFARDHGNVPLNKEFYVALEELPTRHK